MHRFLPARTEQNKRIAQRLVERRMMMPQITGEKKPPSQRTVAAALGWDSHTNLVRYENGDVASYDSEKLRRAARLYRCSVQDFFLPPGSPWTEHKLPRRTAAPLRMHAPTKHLDVDVRFPIKLPPLTKTMAEVRALKKWMRCRNDLPTSILFGANNSGMGAVLDMLSGSMIIKSVSISHHGRA